MELQSADSEDLAPGESLTQKRIRHLRLLLEGFSDEIPDHIVSGGGDYKVRRQWWYELFNFIDVLKLDCLITDPVITMEAEALYQKFMARLATRDLLTKREEIDAANNLLRKLIAHLESSLS